MLEDLHTGKLAENSLGMSEIQNLADSIMQATRNVSKRGEHELAFHSMVTLARASLFMSWEQKQTINRLRERLTVRDSQVAVSTEKSEK